MQVNTLTTFGSGTAQIQKGRHQPLHSCEGIARGELMRWRKLVPRRDFLQAGAGACLSARARANSGDQDLIVTLVKQFPSAALVAVSPDAKHICFYFNRDPIRSFTFDGKWNEAVSAKAGADGLQIVETGSWNSAGGLRLRQRPLYGSFFANGEDF